MGNASKFNNSGLENYEVKTVEKVHYMGELRIVGQVVNSITDKEPIGYVVMTERTQKFKMYTINQTISLLGKFKFVNAELSNGKIVNTECAMSRLPKYSTNMRVVGNPGVIILGEIVDNDTVIGYRALDTNGRIADLTEDEVIMLNDNGVGVINAKIVNRNNKSYVSAIKNEFTKIEKSKIKELRIKQSKGFLWRKQMHVNKWNNYIGKQIMIHIFAGTCGIVNDFIMARYPESTKTFGGGYLDLNREATILAKEVYTTKNNITLSPEDVELYKRIIKEVPHKQLIGYTGENKWVDPDDNDKLFIALISQFVLNNPEKQELVVKTIKNRGSRNTTFVNKILNSGYAGKAFKETWKKIKEYDDARAEEFRNNPYGLTAEDKKRMFRTKNFCSAKDIAQLGFAVSESNKEYEFETETGFHKTLLYLGDVIGPDYNMYKEKSRCLGDLAAVANLTKLTDRFYGYAHNGDEMRAVIEMIIAIAFLYGSEAVKLYTERNAEKLSNLNIEVPDFVELSGTDYMLPPEVKMYYASGFNVFLNDGNYNRRNYKRKYLRHAELINYRQLGIAHNISHPMLKEELGAIVNMVTSDNCDSDLIDKLIGQLRYL